jgi:hypothetical protein
LSFRNPNENKTANTIFEKNDLQAVGNYSFTIFATYIATRVMIKEITPQKITSKQCKNGLE